MSQFCSNLLLVSSNDTFKSKAHIKRKTIGNNVSISMKDFLSVFTSNATCHKKKMWFLSKGNRIDRFDWNLNTHKHTQTSSSSSSSFYDNRHGFDKNQHWFYWAHFGSVVHVRFTTTNYKWKENHIFNNHSHTHFLVASRNAMTKRKERQKKRSDDDDDDKEANKNTKNISGWQSEIVYAVALIWKWYHYPFDLINVWNCNERKEKQPSKMQWK